MSNGSGSSSAVLIFVFGILSLMGVAFCPLLIPLGPLAWIMGNYALRDIEAGIGNPQDRGLVMAGRILGIISTVLLALGVVLFCLYMLFFAAIFGAAGASSL